MVYGFKTLKWYGLRRRGGLNRSGKTVVAVLGAYDLPNFEDFGPEPQPGDELVKLKLVVEKVLEEKG